MRYLFSRKSPLGQYGIRLVGQRLIAPTENDESLVVEVVVYHPDGTCHTLVSFEGSRGFIYQHLDAQDEELGLLVLPAMNLAGCLSEFRAEVYP